MFLRSTRSSTGAWVFFLTLVVGAISFFSFFRSISTNTASFIADEMYWIRTGGIVPLLARGDYKDPLWNEYWGYANFNGAKIFYGIGLSLFGHTEAEFDTLGLPPQTYFRFQKFEGGVFPASNDLYHLLRDGRTVSAIFASASLGLFFVFLILLLRRPVLALGVSLALLFHPIVQEIATHALGDSMFLFFECLLLVVSEWYLAKKQKTSVWFPFCIGAILAGIASIKLNGLMFFGVFLVYEALRQSVRTLHGARVMLTPIAVCTVGFFLVFTMLHPNFFFYPERSPVTIILDRVRITKYHMEYFGKLTPSHILRTFPQRITSSVRHIFANWQIVLVVLMGSIGALVELIVAAGKNSSPSRRTTGIFLSIYLVIITYVVFDEGRYFLPVLPLLLAVAGCGFRFMTGALGPLSPFRHG